MKTPEQLQRARDLAKANRLRNKLANNDVHNRQLASQRRHSKAKSETLAEQRAAGIKPIPVVLSEERKEAMRLYAIKKRAEAKALKPPKAKKTKRTTKQPKPIKQVIPKPIKMQKTIRQSPPATTSTYHKPDHFKQPTLKILNNSIEGKTKIAVKPGLTVYAAITEEYTVDMVRAKYLNR